MTIVALTLALIALWAFLPALENGFVNFDDGLYVTDSAWLHEGLTWRSARWAFEHFYASNWHPLTWLSHMLDCQFFGLQPGIQVRSILICAHEADNIIFSFESYILRNHQGVFGSRMNEP